MLLKLYIIDIHSIFWMKIRYVSKQINDNFNQIKSLKNTKQTNKDENINVKLEC